MCIGYLVATNLAVGIKLGLLIRASALENILLWSKLIINHI